MDYLSQSSKNQGTGNAPGGHYNKQGGRPRNRNRKGASNGQTNERKFTGLNQDELKGIVVDGSKSIQYDKLFEALKIVAGKKNSRVKTTLISMTMLTEQSFQPDIPKREEYTTTNVNNEEIVDNDKKRLLEELWVKKGERSAKKFELYLEDLKGMFSTIEGQLSPSVKQQLKTDESWNDIEVEQDTLRLLKTLREYCYRDSSTKVHPMVDAANKILKLFSCRQDGNKDAASYAEETKAKFDVLVSAGITIRSKDMIKLALKKTNPGTTYSEYEKMDAPSKRKVGTAMEEMLLSVIIVNGSNNKSHRNLSGVLKDNYSLGSDVYPTTQPRALELMHQYKSTRGSGNATNTNTTTPRTERTNHNQNNQKDDKTTEETALVANATNEDPEVSEAHQILMAGVADGTVHDELCFIQFGPTTTYQGTETTKNPRSAPDHLTETHQISEDVELMFSQSLGTINPHWVLLDSQATCNCISNPNLLRNIRLHPEGRKVRIHCNAGSVLLDQVGDLPGFGPVWYQEGGMANILSLSLVSDSYRVTLDTSITQSFFVHKPDGNTRRFDRAPNGLYYCDLKEEDGTILAITSVEGQKKLYSDLDVRRATKARKLQETLGFPSMRDYLQIIDNNMLLNCPVTRRDIMIADDIFGANNNIVKGKAVRKQPEHTREDVTPVPAEILSRYQNITLGIDIFTVNGIKFFRSVSRHIYFRTVTAIEDSTQATIQRTINAIAGLYASRGFVITTITGDNEFNCVVDHLLSRTPPIRFEGVARNQHEPFVERDNRTCKERIRCMFASIPFKRLPRRMTIDMVSAGIFWLNNWCNRVGVSKTISPRHLMTGVRIDAAKHCKFQFGDYVLAHEDTNDNTMSPRAHDTIYLRPTGDRSGAMYLFDLQTGRRIRRRTATLAHMTNAIITRVEHIATEQSAPIGLTFGDSDGHTTILDLDTDTIGSDDDASDRSFLPDDNATIDSDAMAEELDPDEVRKLQEEADIAAVEEDVAPNNDDNSDEEASVDPHAISSDEGTINSNDHSDRPGVDNGSVGPADAPDAHSEASTNADDTSITSERAEPLGAPDSETVDTPLADYNSDSDNNNAASCADTSMDDSEEPVSSRLRPRVTRGHNKFGANDGYEGVTHHRALVSTHSHLFSGGLHNAVHKLESDHNQYVFISNAIASYNNINASLVTRQYGIKAGLKLFGTAGVEAVLSELKQLHDRKVVHPVDIKQMTKEEVKRALPYLMFLKRKRCGKIKARGCADGRSQRDFISREDTYSPTVSLHGLMLTCLIDAIEGRDVATADIPGAFLQTPMPEGEVVHIQFDGPMAELLAKTDPNTYQKFMLNRRGNKTLYTQADRAIYGTLWAALLFWERLSGQLIDWGFELNPYDTCTANKMIDGTQCTIVWHVDDLKISHEKPEVVTRVLDDLNRVFGVESPLTVTQGRVHDYVGMTIDYSEPGKVKFSMFDYLEGIVSDLPEGLQEARIIPTPASSHLFKVDVDGNNKLNRRDAELFHTHVAQLLFTSKRARPYIQTAIAFLCTRVASPDQDDWKKLRRVLAYIRDTIFLPLVLGWDESGKAHWYVDASFAVHSDMKSHTGGVLTFGQGAVLAVSTKQKLNTKSSTEAELVGVDDTLPYNLWCYYYLEWQGYLSQPEKENNPNDRDKSAYLGKDNILHQDNTSAMRLEMNGKSSSTKRTRHINIRYFLITDRVKQGEMSIQYCPTGDMLADYFTKPVQGALFRKFRNTIMGISDAEFIEYEKQYAMRKGKA